MRAVSRALALSVAIVAALPAGPRAQSSSDFFNPNELQQLELWVNSDDWEKLKENFQENTYYPADVTWKGQTIRNVGIRSRGLGSRSSTKPGLRVDIDYYSTRQEFLGMKSFILDNLIQDKSGIHETTAMRLFAKMGIPASRETHVKLFVKGRYAGLYALVESVDKAFLARVFGSIGDDVQNDGHLYEYKYKDRWLFNHLGSDLGPYSERFEPKTHEGEGNEAKWRRIEQLVRLVNELPSDRFMSDINPRLDLRQFIRYLAVQSFLAENDGFAGYDGMNNFYFYRKENSEQHVFIAWDEDNAFDSPEFPLAQRFDENVLVRKAMEVRELRDLYYETVAEAADIADARPDGSQVGWLETEIRRQLEMIGDAIGADTNKPYSNDEHDQARDAMIRFSTQRSRWIRENLPR